MVRAQQLVDDAVNGDILCQPSVFVSDSSSSKVGNDDVLDEIAIDKAIFSPSVTRFR